MNFLLLMVFQVDWDLALAVAWSLCGPDIYRDLCLGAVLATLRRLKIFSICFGM